MAAELSRGDRVSWGNRLLYDWRSPAAEPLFTATAFDLVVLIDPASWGTGPTARVDEYVAMTRATRELVVLAP